MPESTLTKKAITKSLKKLTKEKPFDKIVISEIADGCGINRQTFYYHFKDKYALLKWIYTTEYIEPYMKDVTFENWDTCILNILDQLKKDKDFSINTIKHANYFLITFFIEVAEELFEDAINVLDEKNVVDHRTRKFFARFFAYGVCGMVTEWVLGGMKEEPKNISKNLKLLLDSSEKAAYRQMSNELNS